MKKNFIFLRTAFTSLSLLLSLSYLVAGNTIPLGALLDNHGKMANPRNLTGEVDFSGFYPVMDECEGLVFLPTPVAPGWNALGTGLGAIVRAIAISGSDVYVGGNFIDAGGNAGADNIARWNGSSWNALGSGLNNPVRAIAISGSNVYVGGSFTDAGGNANADYVARWNGSSWNALGTGVNATVRAIAISGSDVYVSGNFTDAGGNANADRIARWDGATWNALGSGLSADVFTVAIAGNGDVYAGGDFLNAGGNANADYVARWDGSAWNALGTTPLNVGVNAIAISGSDVYVGGGFTNAGGNANADMIARWDGSSWNALGSGLSDQVVSIATSGSNVYVGGGFISAGGNANATRIARWNGSSWSALGTGLNSSAVAIAISGNNVYAGGNFTDGGGNLDVDRIGRWEGPACPTFSGAPANVTITNSTCASACTLSGGAITAPGGMPCPAGSTLQYQVNSGSWSSTLPIYDQDGPAQSIKTRCVCDTDANMTSAESAAVATIPGTCVTPTLMGPSSVAVNAMITLTGSGTPAVSMPYTSNNMGVATVNSSGVVTGVSAGMATITYTNAGGCTTTKMVTVIVACPSGTTLHVNASVSGGTGDGTSWANAYASLSDALAVAHTCSNITTIKVAAGTYTPTKKPFDAGVEMTTTDDRDVVFHIPDGVTIEGGYNATTDSRDITANVTILSGDIGTAGSNADNCYHVIIASAASSGGVGVTIDGFSITGGNANGSSFLTVNGNTLYRIVGGGILAQYGTNTLSNNTLYSNSVSGDGGGIYIFGGNNTLSNNTLYSNSAIRGGGISTHSGTNTLSNNTLYSNSAIGSVSGSGGGIWTFGGTNTLSNNTLYSNTAELLGGGIYVQNGTNNTLSNNTLYNNSAGVFGGFVSFGGGIYVQNGTNTLSNNTLYNNSAHTPGNSSFGGGIYTFGGTNTLSNNTLYNNSAGDIFSSGSGGGIYTDGGTNTLSNNTLYNNSAGGSSGGGSGIYTVGGTNTLSNNIFWANKINLNATVAGADYYADGTNGNTFKNNLLQLESSNYTTTGTGNYDLGTGASGNLFAQDPLFVNAADPDGADNVHRTADDGLALQSTSLMLGQGLTGTGIPTTDITGATRPNPPSIGAYDAAVPCSPAPPVAGSDTWTGCVSTDWATAGNWLDGTVPTAADNVTIPDVTNDPVIMDGTMAVANSVHIQPSTTLTINATGMLTINGSATFGSFTAGFYNQGMVSNSGTMILGSTASVGENGIWNQNGVFNNNSNGEISIDRSSGSGLWNENGTITNVGKITIGALASVGFNGIWNQNGGNFDNNSDGEISIGRSTERGVWNQSSTITNTGKITIGAVEAVGFNGIRSASTFNNNSDGEISIDRSNAEGLFIEGGTFTNAGKITIGAVAVVGTYGLRNFGILNNNSSGEISIDRSSNTGLLNAAPTPTITNEGRITIGAVAAVGTYGVQNFGTFHNNTCSALVRIVSDAIVENTGTFTNVGVIVENAMGNSSITSNSGIVQNLNGGMFTIGTGNPAITTLGTVENACCPTFSGAPANVSITDSSCGSGCALGGGSITAPSGTPCPTGSTLQYNVNNSGWTTTLPTYHQAGPAQSIRTRCSCDNDANNVSAESNPVSTIPGTLSNPVVPANGSSTVACPSAATPPTPPTVMGCDGSVITPTGPMIVNSPNPVTCEGTRTYTYTYTCGSTSSTWSFVYTIERNTFTVPANGSSTVACLANATAPTPPTVTSNCGETLTPTGPVVTDSPDPLTCEGTRTYAYTYTDCEGNAQVWSYVYTIEREPFTVPADGGSTVACLANATAPTLPTVTSNCGETLTPTGPVVTDSPNPLTCEGTRTYAYTYTDCEGNAQVWSYVYTIEREPFTVPADGGSTVACLANATAPTLPTVTSNCGETLTPTGPVVTDSPDPLTCEGTRTYAYTYTDCEGNAQVWSYVYTIEREPFTVPADGGSTVACLANATAPTLPTVTSNCGETLTPTGPVVTDSPNPLTCEGTRTYAYTYTDCEGNAQVWSYVYTIEREPFTVPSNGGSTVNAPALAVQPTPPVVTSNCGEVLTPSGPVVTEDPDPIVCTGARTYTWTYTDCEGNAQVWSYVYTIIDNELPSVTCLTQSVIFNGEQSISLNTNALVSASDNCGIQSIQLSPNSVTSAQVGQTVPVTVTVTDINNNVNTCTANVTVSGLPAGWSQTPGGIGCATSCTDFTYNTGTGVWTGTSTGAYYGPPFTGDAAAFAQRTLCGDGSITVQVTSVTGGGWAGIVMRESNDAGAKKAQLMANLGPQNRREFRIETNGMASPQQFTSSNRYWLRIVRAGNQFTLYTSPNGTTWYVSGGQNIVMPSCIQMGLVVTNNTANSTVTATFAGVSYMGSNSPLGSPLTGHALTPLDSPLTPEFEVYPNPTGGELNVDLTQYVGRSVRMELYSIEGKLLQFREIDEVQTTMENLNLSQYANGMYFVKVQSRDIPAATKRVVLNR